MLPAGALRRVTFSSTEFGASTQQGCATRRRSYVYVSQRLRAHPWNSLPGANYLYALANFSITFVGFSALLLVFRQTNGGKMTSYDSYFKLAFICRRASSSLPAGRCRSCWRSLRCRSPSSGIERAHGRSHIICRHNTQAASGGHQ
jgi:hypothetical protein